MNIGVPVAVATSLERINASKNNTVKIVSWMGGEHWYIGNVRFLRLEEAIAACGRKGLVCEIVRDPSHVYRMEGD